MDSLSFGKSNARHNEKYYISIENIEQIKEDTYELIFDGIESNKLNFYSRSTLLDSYEEIEPYLFSITVNLDQYNTFLNFFKREIFKSKWFHLSVSKKETNLPVSIIKENYTNEETIPEEKFISSISQIHSGKSVSKTLNNYFSWKNFKLSNKKELIDILNSTNRCSPDEAHKLNVYNVGQGSLTAIANESNIPLLYFDLGGGFAWNKKTYPTTLNLCFTQTRTVIISHWDGDHLETAQRYFATNPTLLTGITWIIPEQNITATYFKLAAKMRATGSLIIWPKVLKGAIDLWFGKLIKCYGPDKNHSGLALYVDSPNNSITKVLNPGDAAYKFIPNIKKIKFDGLLATHHGANFDDNNSPVPQCLTGNIAYSHGTTNYGHPKPNAVLAHDSGNWTNKLYTPNSHISFVTGDSNLEVGCNGSNCDLTIAQTF